MLSPEKGPAVGRSGIHRATGEGPSPRSSQAEARPSSEAQTEIDMLSPEYKTGLYHVRNRTYHPAVGRFMQRDPIGYVDGMSLYGSCGNNPPNATDPFGYLREQWSMLADVGESPAWTVAAATVKLTEWQILAGADGNYYAVNLMEAFLTRAGGYVATAADKAQVKADMAGTLV